MATRVRPKPEELYDRDFYVWTERQAELLRARRFQELRTVSDHQFSRLARPMRGGW